MPAEIRDSILATIRKLLGTNTAGGAGDAELLRRFVQGRDESAFELLVWRHAALVLGVCRQLLHEEADVEDAFQATFLVLARKAASISHREALAGFLHTVAFRVALRARRQAARRRGEQRDLDQVPAPAGAEPLDPDVRLLLHEEVVRLPARYRLPIVCCYLEGKTHEEAAVELGWRKGTVAGRLARARDLLRSRLARRGVGPAAALALEGLSGPAAPARRIGVLIAGLRGLMRNETASAGLSAAAEALATGVIREMFWTKTRWAALAVLGLGLVGLGGTLAPGRDEPASASPREHAAKDEAPR